MRERGSGWERRVLVGLVVLALAIRLAAIVALRTYDLPSEWAAGYEMGNIAASLAGGDGFLFRGRPSAAMAPLYPYLLSFIFRAAGMFSATSIQLILAIQSLTSALTIVPVFYLARRLFGRDTALVAAALWGLHPGALRYSSSFIWSSSLAALGLATMALFLDRLRSSAHAARWAVGWGLVAGLTCLTEPALLTFVPLAWAWLLWRAGEARSRAAGQVLVSGLVIAVVLAPWLLHNYRVFDSWVPIKSNFGRNFWQGNNPYVSRPGHHVREYEVLVRHLPRDQVDEIFALDEVQLNRLLQRRAVEFVRQNPGTFLTYTIDRILLFWTISFQSLESLGGNRSVLGTAVVGALAWFYAGSRVATMAGALLSWKQWRETLPILLSMVLIPLPYYLTIADSYRYRFPLEPLMMILAALALTGVARFIVRIRGRGIGPRRLTLRRAS